MEKKTHKRKPPPPPPATSRHSYTSSTSPGLKPKKPVFKPITPRKATVHDLFGSDSDDDTIEHSAPVNGKNKLPSYITTRLANGQSRKIFENKPGTHYIDLKIYRCDEIESVQAMNRWRQAIVTVKSRTDDNTDSWQHLANFIMSTKKEYRNCPSTFISNYY